MACATAQDGRATTADYEPHVSPPRTRARAVSRLLSLPRPAGRAVESAMKQEGRRIPVWQETVASRALPWAVFWPVRLRPRGRGSRPAGSVAGPKPIQGGTR
ncbi:hypothetical protein GCM10010324_13510 [Streptomyces hiroshimensis]|uniref:Uncharacterized protein n=1 Tax=Streptomyces hiroshimensis TaxID=66424 RepID=A0ABQ2Y6H7_9ACTN|nr:hypothetical protein GCM10010324_13510 [Streptomyces hiroshimensis]